MFDFALTAEDVAALDGLNRNWRGCMPKLVVRRKGEEEEIGQEIRKREKKRGEREEEEVDKYVSEEGDTFHKSISRISFHLPFSSFSRSLYFFLVRWMGRRCHATESIPSFLSGKSSEGMGSEVQFHSPFFSFVFICSLPLMNNST